MRKFIVTAAIAALASVGATAATGATEGSPANVVYAGSGDKANAREPGWRLEECRFATLDGEYGFSVGEVRKTIICAADHWRGNLELGLAIVGCESGFIATNQNPYSSAGGVWQAIDSTWDSWLANQSRLVESWDLRQAKHNGRSNAVMGWRVFAPANTGPWSSSQSCWG